MNGSHPNGEGAVLKTVSPRGPAGSPPATSAISDPLGGGKSPKLALPGSIPGSGAEERRNGNATFL